MDDFIKNYVGNSDFNNKKLYITGHSRGGMLAQRATAELIEKDKSKGLEELVYFNGMGIFFNPQSKKSEATYAALEKEKNKVKRLAIKGDLVNKLGKHVTSAEIYARTDVMGDEIKKKSHKSHAMANFTHHFEDERFKPAS